MPGRCVAGVVIVLAFGRGADAAPGDEFIDTNNVSYHAGADAKEYKALQRSVTPADRDRLEQFATGIRDLEKRLAAAEHWLDRPKPKTAAKPPDATTDANDLAFNARTMLDLVRLALETDSTRVVTVCFNTTSLTPTKLGVHSQYHGGTHHGQQPAAIAALRRIEEAQLRAVNDFLAGLKAAREPGGSLLDRTGCLYGTNMGSANAHSNDNLPVLLAGGKFSHGRHLAFDRANNYPFSNLYVSLLQWIGIETNTFASGTLRGLEFAFERSPVGRWGLAPAGPSVTLAFLPNRRLARPRLPATRPRGVRAPFPHRVSRFPRAPSYPPTGDPGR